MYPSKEKAYSGIFVKNQFLFLKNELNQDVEIYAMKRSFTSKIGSLIKYMLFYLKFFPFLFKKFDTIHVHFFGYHVFLAVCYKFFHRETKLVATFHGGDSYNISKKIFQLWSVKFDEIIGVGDIQSNEISLKLSNRKINVICAGIDESVFFPEVYKYEFDFIFIGSFYEIKGIDILIAAIKKSTYLKMKICLIGSGDYGNEIPSLKKYCDLYVYDNLKQHEIRKFLSKSKFLILPSRGDSFGLVVTESMFCGTPVIVSNVSGVAQQVKHNYNGFILNENTEDELSRIMSQVLNIRDEDYNLLRMNASKSNKQYSLKNVCEELLLLYKK